MTWKQRIKQAERQILQTVKMFPHMLAAKRLRDDPDFVPDYVEVYASRVVSYAPYGDRNLWWAALFGLIRDGKLEVVTENDDDEVDFLQGQFTVRIPE